MIAAAIIMAGFMVLFFRHAGIMLWLAKFSPWLAAAFGAWPYWPSSWCSGFALDIRKPSENQPPCRFMPCRDARAGQAPPKE